MPTDTIDTHWVYIGGALVAFSFSCIHSLPQNLANSVAQNQFETDTTQLEDVCKSICGALAVSGLMRPRK